MDTKMLNKDVLKRKGIDTDKFIRINSYGNRHIRDLLVINIDAKIILDLFPDIKHDLINNTITGFPYYLYPIILHEEDSIYSKNYDILDNNFSIKNAIDKIYGYCNKRPVFMDDSAYKVFAEIAVAFLNIASDMVKEYNRSNAMKSSIYLKSICLDIIGNVDYTYYY